MATALPSCSAVSSAAAAAVTRRSLAAQVSGRSGGSVSAAASLLNIGTSSSASCSGNTNAHGHAIASGRSIHMHARSSWPTAGGDKFDNKPPLSSFKNIGPVRVLSSGSKKDFYDVLGVARGSDKGTVKKAYFKLAKQYHPDTNKDDEKAADKFKEVTEAYEVLSDDKQRELYDQFGHAGVDPNSGFGGGGPGGMGGNPFGGAGGFEGVNFGDGSFHFSSGGGPGGQEIDPEELFDAFFGAGRRRPRGPRRGADLQMHVRLSFMEAVFGSSQDLHLRYQVRNPETGAADIKEREVTVETPAGIDHGMNLRLSGQGAEGDPGAPRGNLIVQVLVDDDEYFQRDGTDVHTEVPISIVQAILGGAVDVKTLTGTAEVTVPKGCQPGAKLALRGKGIERLHGAMKGNQIVHLKIEVPKEITPRQEELLREFDEETKTGISGGVKKAVGSAFERFFGGSGDHDEKNESDEAGEKDKNRDTTSSENKGTDDEEYEQRKQA